MNREMGQVTIRWAIIIGYLSKTVLDRELKSIYHRKTATVAIRNHSPVQDCAIIWVPKYLLPV